MSPRTLSRLAAAACGFSIAIAGVGLVAEIVMHRSANPPPGDLGFGAIIDVLMNVMLTLVGGLISIRRPGNLIGWAMILAGSTLGGAFGVYGDLALFTRRDLDLPGGGGALAVAGGSWTTLMCGIFLIVLLFPSGHVPSRRWRPVAKAVVLGFALIWFLIATAPGKLDPPYEEYGSSFAFTQNGDYLSVLLPIIPFCLLSFAAAVIDLFVRFRRSRGETREQYKWLAFTGGVLVAMLPFGGLQIGVISNITGRIFALGLLALPISIGIAVMRYNLYEIDRIVNRALVYGAVTALAAASYFALVVGLQELLRPLSGGSDLAIVITTLVVAALFLPARQRVQDLVDRRFNRRQYDAARTIDAFSARLREQIELDTLRYELLAVIDETMAPSSANLWLRSKGARV